MAKLRLALAWLRRYGTWLLVALLAVAVSVLWLSLRAARRREAALYLQQKLAALKAEADAAYATAVEEYTARDLVELDGQATELRETMDENEAKRRVEREKEDKELEDATAEDVAAQFRRDGF